MWWAMMQERVLPRYASVMIANQSRVADQLRWEQDIAQLKKQISKLEEERHTLQAGKAKVVADVSIPWYWPFQSSVKAEPQFVDLAHPRDRRAGDLGRDQDVARGRSRSASGRT